VNGTVLERVRQVQGDGAVSSHCEARVALARHGGGRCGDPCYLFSLKLLFGIAVFADPVISPRRHRQSALPTATFPPLPAACVSSRDVVRPFVSGDLPLNPFPAFDMLITPSSCAGTSCPSPVRCSWLAALRQFPHCAGPSSSVATETCRASVSRVCSTMRRAVVAGDQGRRGGPGVKLLPSLASVTFRPPRVERRASADVGVGLAPG